MKFQTMKSAPLLGAALLLSLAFSASAEPAPAKPNNQAALQQRAAAARQHQLLAAHSRATNQQHLLKTHENFTKLHLIEQSRRPAPLPPPEGLEYGQPVATYEYGAKAPTYEYGSREAEASATRAPITRVQRD